MKLILAQGNPEARYNGTRHNLGFALLDTFAKAYNATWVDRPKFHAHIAEITIDSEKVILAKPTTYYNETGVSARALVDFYKVEPGNILVIHDDLYLPFGTIRVRSKGSDAGNNGVKSVNAHLNEAFRRIRVGIWNEQRDQIDDVNFVLGKLAPNEAAQMPAISAEVTHFIDAFINETLEDHSISLSVA